MASYGSIFEFVFDSVNGAEINIVILRRDYNGEVVRRPLGRAPVLRRENNDHIYGTSLEIYAECLNDGEYASLYSSSAYEHMVEVYKDDVLIWTGFVTPELYSEPDIAPPYDVQIIATDGLGELKNYEFDTAGMASMWSHLRTMLAHTGMDLQYDMISALTYQVGGMSSLAVDLMDLQVNLDHEVGSTCYDVLQRLLAGLNMSITQRHGRWLVFRETDLISLASYDGVQAFDNNGYSRSLPVASFGSSDNNDWWPVGQLSTVIEPAKKKIALESPNHYRPNVFAEGGWQMASGATYNSSEGAYVLPSAGAKIVQKIDFDNIEVGYRLALRVRARNAGSGEADQNIGLTIKIDGRSYAAGNQFWLVELTASDRGSGGYAWRNVEGSIMAELAVPAESDTSSDAQDIDIILPLFKSDSRSYQYATNVEVTVFNPAGVHDIYVYDVALAKYDQFEGYQADVIIGNNAREEASSVELGLTDGSTIPAAGYIFMSGVPMTSDLTEAITGWSTTGIRSRDYISFMAYDYSRAIALPRMMYKGSLNVPRVGLLPMLFYRDGTFYFPRTYSYNLLEDELEIDMISISSADVSLDSVDVTAIAESRGTMPSGSSAGGSGGGIGSGAAGDLRLGDLRDVNLKDSKEGSVIQKKGDEWKSRTVQEVVDEYLKEVKKLGEWFELDDKGNIRTHKNFYSTGTVASGGAAKEGQGNSGATSGEYKMYTHVQGDPRAEWVINHGLNKVPNVKVIDSVNGEEVFGAMKVENMNVVTIRFGGAFSGTAYLD